MIEAAYPREAAGGPVRTAGVGWREWHKACKSGKGSPKAVWDRPQGDPTPLPGIAALGQGAGIASFGLELFVLFFQEKRT